jgi:hypothetical protein
VGEELLDAGQERHDGGGRIFGFQLSARENLYRREYGWV